MGFVDPPRRQKPSPRSKISGPATPREPAALDWRRPAGGGYLGLGIGGKIRWFSPWLRLRTQASAAEGIPIASLSNATVGVQFSIAELAHIYAGTGAYLIATPQLSSWGWGYVDAGLSFTIPTARTRNRRARAGR